MPVGCCLPSTSIEVNTDRHVRLSLYECATNCCRWRKQGTSMRPTATSNTAIYFQLLLSYCFLSGWHIHLTSLVIASTAGQRLQLVPIKCMSMLCFRSNIEGSCCSHNCFVLLGYLLLFDGPNMIRVTRM